MILGKFDTIVIVAGSIQRKNLATIRSLGKVGHQVHVISEGKFTPGARSRYCSKRIRKRSNQSYLETIEKLEYFGEKPIYLPMEEIDVYELSLNQDQLATRYGFLVAPSKSIEVAMDKSKTMELAKALNIPIPKTIYVNTFEELTMKLDEFLCTSQADDYLSKPVNGSGSKGVLYFADLEHSVSQRVKLRHYWEEYGPLIIQRRIPSDGMAIGVSMVFDKNSNLVANFTHKRLHSFPNSGGPSTDRVSIEMPELVAMSEKLLKFLNWQGVAMVEWKIDPLTEIPYLLEINPRFWGSLELAVRSGVDFPRILVDLIRLKTISYPVSQEGANRCRWVFPGEILRYITSKKELREPLHEFMDRLIADSEEFDRSDLRGTLFAMAYPISFLFKKRYFHLLRR